MQKKTSCLPPALTTPEARIELIIFLYFEKKVFFRVNGFSFPIFHSLLFLSHFENRNQWKLSNRVGIVSRVISEEKRSIKKGSTMGGGERGNTQEAGFFDTIFYRSAYSTVCSTSPWCFLRIFLSPFEILWKHFRVIPSDLYSDRVPKGMWQRVDEGAEKGTTRIVRRRSE